jgi:4-diphosphocytidyl-2-C-methyl-D-erythritol kinase
MLAGFAPAKINLCLHVTGRRADGYHLLDSLVAFAGAGDRLSVRSAATLGLTLGGPFGQGLAAEPDNLVLKAARALAARLRRPEAALLSLEKHLPLASGIGGGSADAAATLRLLCTLWGVPPPPDLADLALQLGADVPVCLASKPARMRGIGERLDPVDLPAFGLALVNPGYGVPTGPVFRALQERRGDRFSPPLAIPRFAGVAELAAWLRTTTNDLQDPAESLCPAISAVIQALTGTRGCLLARMSGSGATCFGLYETARHAQDAVASLPTDWWSWGGAARH